MKQLNNVLILIILLLQVNLFSNRFLVISNTVWNSYTSKYLTVMLIVIFLFINYGNLLFKNTEKLKMGNLSLFYTPIIALLVYVVFLIFNSKFVYQQSLFSSITASYYYFILCFYFVFVGKTRDNISFEFLTNTVVFIGTVYSLLLILQGVLYSKGLEILNIGQDGLSVEAPTFGVNIARIKEPADFISFTILILLVKIILKKKSALFLWILTFFNLCYVVLVSQTRVYILIDVLLITIVILTLINRVNHKIFLLSLAVIILLAILGVSGIFSWFLVGNRQISYSVRIDAIRYFLHEVPRNSPLGIGFPNALWNQYMLHGNLLTFLGYQYYLDDIGIFGFYTVFGILGIFILLLFFLDFFRSFMYSHHKVISFIIIVYVVTTSGTLLLFNVQRILYLPILLYILDYVCRNGIEELDFEN